MSVKRTAKNEITGLKIEYSDRKGNKGKMELKTPPITITNFSKNKA
jgi:hypothetical protein